MWTFIGVTLGHSALDMRSAGCWFESAPTVVLFLKSVEMGVHDIPGGNPVMI